MTGLIYIESVESKDFEATPDRLILRLKSDGETIKLMLSRHAALSLRNQLRLKAGPLLSPPNAEVVPLYAGCTDCPRVAQKRKGAPE